MNKISLITVCFNSEKTIEDTINSVLKQNYDNYEYIVVDGGSTDGTLKIIEKYKKSFNGKIKIISEKDNGLYDAMNKGIKISSGDVIGILNSDDILANNFVFSNIDKIMDNGYDGVYADLVFMDSLTMSIPVRNFIAHNYNKKFGWHPPHPTLYLKKKVYDKVGMFNLEYKICADYDFMLRMLKENFKIFYCKEYFVKMRSGGKSTNGLKGYINNLKEANSVLLANKIKLRLFMNLLRIFKTINQAIDARIHKKSIIRRLHRESNPKIAIDLLWIKPNKNGGTESLYRNVLDGLSNLDNDRRYVLITSKNNSYSFKKYLNDKRFEEIVVDIDSENLIQRLLWINFRYYHFLNKNNLNFIFFPTYAMPIFKCQKIKMVTGIMDLQAIHYPQYFTKFERIYFNLSWKRDTKVANRLFTISNYSKDDIEKTYKLKKNSVSVIYATCELTDKPSDFKLLAKEFKIKKNEYYFTVSSLLPHKNLLTLIKVMNYIKINEKDNYKMLVISGIGGKAKNDLLNMIKQYDLEDRIVLTRFVSNAERNSLYQNASIFLFPSIFEGFGMPPIEAMMLGTKVITTKKTSLPEVTKNSAYYVDDPFNEVEWAKKIKKIDKITGQIIEFPEYSKKSIAQEYLDLFDEVKGEQ